MHINDKPMTGKCWPLEIVEEWDTITHYYALMRFTGPSSDF